MKKRQCCKEDIGGIVEDGKDFDCEDSVESTDEDEKYSDCVDGDDGTVDYWKETDGGTDEEGKDGDGENRKEEDDGDDEDEFFYPLSVEPEAKRGQSEGSVGSKGSIASFDTEMFPEQATVHAAERNLCMWAANYQWDNSWTDFVQGVEVHTRVCYLNGHWDRCVKRRRTS